MMELAYRVPDNYVGSTLRNATKLTQNINKEIMADKSQSFYKTKYSNAEHRNPIMGGTTTKGFP